MADPLLTPAPAPRPATAMKPRTAAKSHPRDSAREIAETVVFVVALVLMLKLFVVEAFVIPTGSMAETLYGYQKIVDCPECGFEFPVNASDEVSPADGRPRPLAGACCPNCRFHVRWDRTNPPPGNNDGDRVLVHKALYAFDPPARGDVVVFKYPVDPQLNGELQNYIKRLWGLGGETIAINRGDLFRTTALTYPDQPRPANPLDAWFGPEVRDHSKTTPRFRTDGNDYTYHNAAPAREAFAASCNDGFTRPVEDGFVIVRKDDREVLSMRRIVYDNDHQSAFLAGRGVPPRWAYDPNSGWTAGGPENMPRTFAHAGDGLGWVRYRHLVPAERTDWEKRPAELDPESFRPAVITNSMGYNSGTDENEVRARESGDHFWVGDLIVEVRADFQSADAEVVLELSKGRHRYQAVFAGGTVRLVRTGPSGGELATRPSGIDGPGEYDLRFANVDCRLRVWVNGKAIDFGAESDYPPEVPTEKFEKGDEMKEGWTDANDVAAPASLGAKGAVTFAHVRLWRDTYFTYSNGFPADAGVAGFADSYYVQPGHFLCLGDNSAQSSDSRKWGTVPERLMLGRAVFVFFPFPPFVPEIRLGFIQ